MKITFISRLPSKINPSTRKRSRIVMKIIFSPPLPEKKYLLNRLIHGFEAFLLNRTAVFTVKIILFLLFFLVKRHLPARKTVLPPLFPTICASNRQSIVGVSDVTHRGNRTWLHRVGWSLVEQREVSHRRAFFYPLFPPPHPSSFIHQPPLDHVQFSVSFPPPSRHFHPIFNLPYIRAAFVYPIN